LFLFTTSVRVGRNAWLSARLKVLCPSPPMNRTHRVNCRSIAPTRVAFTGYGNGFAAAARFPVPGRSFLVWPCRCL
jgi:hypothetical protein